MANNKSAEKRNRQSIIHRDRNRSVRSTLRSAIKKLRTALDAGDAKSAQSLLPETIRVIDVTARKKVIHTNTASRYKSRLSKAVAALG
ncbi:MAG: 30S ribosomal protein S20 [Thermoanaerobaculia bacterium]